MRLIDADKLRHELIMGHDLVGAKYVDMADTVKAITIEWIERFMNRFRTSEGVSGDEYALIHYMLCEWEKENESN